MDTKNDGFPIFLKSKDLKSHVGIVGLSQEDSGPDRLVTTASHLAHMVQQYFDGFLKFSEVSRRREHYQLSRNFVVRTVKLLSNSAILLKKYCVGNPLTEETPLKNLASSALVPETAQEDILQFT